MISAILWQPKKATWFNPWTISVTDPQHRLRCCLHGWLSVCCGEFVTSSRWRLLLAEAQPFEEKGSEKKNRTQDVCTCCSLPRRLGVVLKDWDICTKGRGATTASCPVWGWCTSRAVGGLEGVWCSGGVQQQGQDRTTRSERRQTRLKYFKPNGLWHKQDSSARDLQWI